MNNTQTQSLVETDPQVSAPNNTLTLVPTDFNQQLSVIEARSTSLAPAEVSSQLPAAAAAARVSGPHVRNGKIARLPKPERDLVCRMLRNNLPYPTIVRALDERNITVTERNISNWRTRGGYKEWCAEQERVLQLSLAQDQLTDYLRQNDAGQLPEVGLQVAATQLSQALLQPDTARLLAADPKKYSVIVDMLCRLSTQIEVLQKQRNFQTQIYAKRNPLKESFEDKADVETVRQIFSSKTGKGPNNPNIPHRNYLPAPK